MNIQVTFSFPSIEAFQEFFFKQEIRGLPALPGVVVTGVSETPAPNLVVRGPDKIVAPTIETLPAPATDTAEPKTGKKRGRKSNAEKAALAGEPVAAPETAPAAAASTTLDDVRAALRKLNDKKGVAPCRTVFTEFGAQGVSQVPVEKYDAFIKRCAELANG